MRVPAFPRYEALYTLLVALFAAVVVISNIITIKLFEAPFLGIALPCGILTYPFTFLIGDLVTEIYGPKRARFMVIIGMVISLASGLLLYLTIELPPHSAWASSSDSIGYQSASEYQRALASIFGLNVLAVGASLFAYFVSQLLDIAIFQAIRQATRGSKLWLRNNVSTLLSQFVDTIIISSILLYWGMGMSFWMVLQIASTCYLYKAIFALFDTPLLYAAVALVKRINLPHVEDNLSDQENAKSEVAVSA